MSARTRIIYFILDPYSDSRAPVAAMLQSGGHTSVVRAPVPVLSASAQYAVSHALTDIEKHHDFDNLPIGAGPHFVMGESRTLPNGVADPSRWVFDYLLGRAA